MVRTGTRTPEEVDGAEAPAVEAVVITVTIARTTRLQMNIHLKENEGRSDFQINNYRNRALTHSIQEDY